MAKIRKFLWIFLFLNLIYKFVISLLLMACKQLSEFEKGLIVAYNDCELSLGDIAKKLIAIIHQLIFFSKIIGEQEIIIKKKVVVERV